LTLIPFNFRILYQRDGWRLSCLVNDYEIFWSVKEIMIKTFHVATLAHTTMTKRLIFFVNLTDDYYGRIFV